MQAFQCSAKCCQDQHSSQEVIQRCLSGCMQPVLEAEQKLKSEVEQLQVRKWEGSGDAGIHIILGVRTSVLML